jgi:hypothetical protein
MTKPPNPFRWFDSSPEVIRLVVMMYVRYPLSLRNVEDLLFERGIDICHETVRLWWNRFGPMFAGEVRRKRVQRMRQFTHWRWHLDEVYVKINGEMTTRAGDGPLSPDEDLAEICLGPRLNPQPFCSGASPRQPQSNFKIVHGTPPGAIKCSAYGMTFLAPPGFNLGKIAAAGRAGGLSLGAMNGAVGQYGSFDFQRSRSGGSTTYYPAYQVASNVAVGAYLNGTGIPEILSNAIEDTFAFFKSSNAGNGDQIMGQEIGWDAAAGNASLSCGSGR